jgi:hypothetical protein
MREDGSLPEPTGSGITTDIVIALRPTEASVPGARGAVVRDVAAVVTNLGLGAQLSVKAILLETFPMPRHSWWRS